MGGYQRMRNKAGYDERRIRMNNTISYVLTVVCSVLFGIVSYDVIKLFTRKRRENKNEEAEDVSE